jgi:hypothetical protein
VVAFGPPTAQTKRLAGLPAIDDRDLLAGAVQANAGRFFLRNGTPLVTSAVRRTTPTEGWAAAFDEAVVSVVVDACQAAGVRVDAVVSAIDVMGRGLVAVFDETLIWSDGNGLTAVTWSGGHLANVRRVHDSPSTGAGTGVADCVRVPVPPLATLGADAARFATAYGAALVEPSDEGSPSLAYRPRGDATRRDVGARVSLTTPAVAAGAALLMAALSPGVVARLAERSASRRLATVAPSALAAQRVERDLTLVSGALDEAAAFDASGRSMTRVLGALTRALPPGVALVELRVDSAGGSLAAIAPEAGGSEVLAALDRMPGVAAPEIVGSVTRETDEGREVERVTVRFRWVAPPRVGGRS